MPRQKAFVLVLCFLAGMWAQSIYRYIMRPKAPIVCIFDGGGVHLAPPNTLTNFVLGLDLGADSIVTSLLVSGDGELVIWNCNYENTCLPGNATANFRRMSYDEIKNVDVGPAFDPAWSDEYAPLLTDVVKLAEQHHAHLLVELHSDAALLKGFPEKFAREARASPGVDFHAFTSFAVHNATPSLLPQIAHAGEGRIRVGLDIRGVNGSSIDMYLGEDSFGDILVVDAAWAFNSTNMDRARTAGKTVFACTEVLEEMEDLIKGTYIGGIITAYPRPVALELEGAGRTTAQHAAHRRPQEALPLWTHDEELFEP